MNEQPDFEGKQILPNETVNKALSYGCSCNDIEGINKALYDSGMIVLPVKPTEAMVDAVIDTYQGCFTDITSYADKVCAAIIQTILQPIEKDCAFQYATGDGTILENTDLITLEEANALWDKYVDQYKEHLEHNDDPEMAIWINMKNDTDYHTTARHWCGSDVIIKDGCLFTRVY